MITGNNRDVSMLNKLTSAITLAKRNRILIDYVFGEENEAGHRYVSLKIITRYSEIHA